MILIKETAGDSLQGDIDGANCFFVCSFDFDDGTVQVYLNGRLKVRGWDDGFHVQVPRTVVMHEPPQVGDSLEVEYKAFTRTGGGAPGGRPEAPAITPLTPGASASEDRPQEIAQNLEPDIAGRGAARGMILPTELRPVILKPEEIS
jgi:hypothetical protein